ncbi:hypothetical protein [Dactylosporangium matsuzakiense]|uniref:hypothetical protein n=1 Tax=Dactylosporangium matsuzakiense TaxID=53360 RepID=UPI0022F31EA2|nr:hypothetical protein [Dactylosporangium matsuzakiense]
MDLDCLVQLAMAGPEGRCAALWEIEKSPDARRVLSGVRRRGPGRLRRPALDALMYLGGEAALEAADRQIVERLVRIRRRVDPIVPVMSCWTYWWAVRSTDQDAVVAALGLTDARPVTYRLAASVIDILEHDSDAEPGLVYVAPSLRGWVALVGPWCDAFGERSTEVRTILAGLSRRFGEAHAFYFGAQGDGSAWHVVRDGVTIRSFSSLDLLASSGEPLPFERDWLAARGLAGRPEDHPDEVWELDANEVAAAISLDVGWHHPVTTDRQGLPILASAPGTGPATLPAGAYEI